MWKNILRGLMLWEVVPWSWGTQSTTGQRWTWSGKRAPQRSGHLYTPTRREFQRTGQIPSRNRSSLRFQTPVRPANSTGGIHFPISVKHTNPWQSRIQSKFFQATHQNPSKPFYFDRIWRKKWKQKWKGSGLWEICAQKWKCQNKLYSTK